MIAPKIPLDGRRAAECDRGGEIALVEAGGRCVTGGTDPRAPVGAAGSNAFPAAPRLIDSGAAGYIEIVGTSGG